MPRTQHVIQTVQPINREKLDIAISSVPADITPQTPDVDYNVHEIWIRNGGSEMFSYLDAH